MSSKSLIYFLKSGKNRLCWYRWILIKNLVNVNVYIITVNWPIGLDLRFFLFKTKVKLLLLSKCLNYIEISCVCGCQSNLIFSGKFLLSSVNAKRGLTQAGPNWLVHWEGIPLFRLKKKYNKIKYTKKKVFFTNYKKN